MADKILEIRNLHKSFGGVHAVNDVTFHVLRGEILGLIGPNGSGKSTIVNLISGIYIPDSGECLLQNESIWKYSIAKRSHLGIGRTFQSPKPFAGISVFNSIYTIALQKHTYKAAEERSLEILDMMGLSSLKDMRSEKLPIEKRKWLDMARILATDPQIIMLDEVMAGLNPSEMDDSIALVQKINQTGITIVFIEHVMKAVMRLCHRIVVINEGQLLCEGNPEEVMNTPEVIKAYLGGG